MMQTDGGASDTRTTPAESLQHIPTIIHASLTIHFRSGASGVAS
jgi:hypothetical protein